ncbi:MAG: HesA/MoeB/ThiF family protein [Bacteroidota bacterium]|nr:HesA/MoeB/ThiF family protein [Bacteroidota bacterium]
MMQPNFQRYSCQLALPGFNESTQQLLQNAKVLIVGAGGLGCPAATYLTACGVGTIGIADYDVISITNLHRQVLYTPAEVGLKKSAIACKKLQLQNPGVSLIEHDVKITSENAMDIVDRYDMVIDCTDNIETKYLLNDACVLNRKPLVYAAIYQYEGQVCVWNVANNDGTFSPNYRDLFPAVDATQVPNCAEGGVIPTLAGIIGCMQANEVIKYITKQGEVLAGKMMLFDAQTMQSRIINAGSVTKTNITALKETMKIPVISAEDLKKVIDTNAYELIDVRSFEEHQSHNIGGKNIPVGEIEKQSSLINFGKPVVLYCASGKRSGEAGKLLKREYPEAEIFSLEGGLQDWNKKSK